MTAGGSAAEQAARARRVAEQRQRAADHAARVAAAWEAGQLGEERLAAILDTLVAEGYLHLPDRCLPGTSANIDHLLIGPPGVFVLDAKNWAGAVFVTHGALRQDDRRRMEEVEAARRAAMAVAASLETQAAKVDVRPALCFVGEARIGTPAFVDRVKLIDADDVREWIRRFPAKLDEAAVDAVHRHLQSSFPAKTGEPAEDVRAVAPNELVVYLVPWKKGTKHRLYVRSTDGADVGYLDLVTGHCSSPSAQWEAVLAQLLPHYLKGDAPGMNRDDLSDEAQGVIRRFLDSVRGRKATAAAPPERSIIACYRWKRHGKDRLYLSRLEPGGHKVELGSFDLDTGLLRAAGPGVAGTLGYCGERFRELEQQRLPFG